MIEMASGSGSVVEHRLAKARVAGSNPVFRSIFFNVDPAHFFERVIFLADKAAG